MVNPIRALVVTLLMVIGSGPAMANNTIDPGAQAVAEAYFHALQTGNSQALLSMFAGRERANNESQLSDPNYSQFLVTRYANARLEINDGGILNGLHFVDITIWLNNTESFSERLILQPATDPAGLPFHIVGRKELGN